MKFDELRPEEQSQIIEEFKKRTLVVLQQAYEFRRLLIGPDETVESLIADITGKPAEEFETFYGTPDFDARILAEATGWARNAVYVTSEDTVVVIDSATQEVRILD